MGTHGDASADISIRPPVDLTSVDGCRKAAERIVCDLLDGTYDDARTRAYAVALKGVGMMVAIFEKKEDREVALYMHEELRASREERASTSSPTVVRASKAHPDVGSGSSDGDET